MRRLFAGRPWRRVFAALIALAVLNAARAVVFPRMFGLGVVVAVVVSECAASIAVGAMMGREGNRLRAARVESARTLRTPAAPAAPDADPGTCRVCGLDDLAYWDDLDTQFDAVGEDRHVVGYGSGRAHRDCALVAPYVAPKPDPQREIVRALQRKPPLIGDRVPDGYRLVGALDAPSTVGAWSLSVGRRHLDIPSGSVLLLAGNGVVRESAVVDHAIGAVTSVVVCRGPLRMAHPAGVALYVSPLPPEPPVIRPINGPLAALVDTGGERFLASVRAACGIAPGSGESEPSNIASDLINAGVLSLDEARRMAMESAFAVPPPDVGRAPVVTGTLRDSVYAGIQERGWRPGPGGRGGKRA